MQCPAASGRTLLLAWLRVSFLFCLFFASARRSADTYKLANLNVGSVWEDRPHFARTRSYWYPVTLILGQDKLWGGTKGRGRGKMYGSGRAALSWEITLSELSLILSLSWDEIVSALGCPVCNNCSITLPPTTPHVQVTFSKTIIFIFCSPQQIRGQAPKAAVKRVLKRKTTKMGTVQRGPGPTTRGHPAYGFRRRTVKPAESRWTDPSVMAGLPG